MLLGSKEGILVQEEDEEEVVEEEGREKCDDTSTFFVCITVLYNYLLSIK